MLPTSNGTTVSPLQGKAHISREFANGGDIDNKLVLPIYPQHFIHSTLIVCSYCTGTSPDGRGSQIQVLADVTSILCYQLG
jgi:hypothetical protein